MFAVITIVLTSYAYTSIQCMRLSNRVEMARHAACIEQGHQNCALIAKFHDDCFKKSYRAELKIRSFHADEYDSCMNSNIAKHRGSESL